MKIFLDTANRDFIKKLVPTGLIDGITTNPTLLSKEDSNTKKVLADICSLVQGPVSIEVIEKQPDALYEQAINLTRFAPNVVVKVPFVQEYLPIIHRLVEQGVKINVTLVFTPIQALLAAKLNVTYISPFVGRWDDIGVDGTNVLEEIVLAKSQYQFSANILAASIRHVLHWQKAITIGADVVTVPPTIFEQAIKHPLTEQGITLFENDWKKLGKKTLLD